MSIAWQVVITYNVSGAYEHRYGPTFTYTYAGAWPYSPYPGAAQFAGASSFEDDLALSTAPSLPTWNDSVVVLLNLTAADRSVGATLGQAYLDAQETAPSGRVVNSVTVSEPPSNGTTGYASARLALPAAFAQIAGAKVIFQVHAADTAGDWIVSPLENYTVLGNGSFRTGLFADDLALMTSPATNSDFGAPAAVAPGTPVAITLQSRDPTTAIAGARVVYTVTVPLLGENTTSSVSLARIDSVTFAGSLPPEPVGAQVSFYVEAWDFSLQVEQSPVRVYAVPSFSSLVPTVPANMTFFYLAVYDAGTGHWVTGAAVSITLAEKSFADSGSTIAGLAYPTIASAGPEYPAVVPADLAYSIEVTDPWFLPPGAASAPVVAFSVYVTHDPRTHGVAAVGSNWVVVQDGALFLVWLNATAPALAGAPPVLPAVGIGNWIGLAAATVCLVPLVRWWRGVQRRKAEEIRRITL